MFVIHIFQASQGPVQPLASTNGVLEQLHLQYLLMVWNIVVTHFARQGSKEETQQFKVLWL